MERMREKFTVRLKETGEKPCTYVFSGVAMSEVLRIVELNLSAIYRDTVFTLCDRDGVEIMRGSKKMTR